MRKLDIPHVWGDAPYAGYGAPPGLEEDIFTFQWDAGISDPADMDIPFPAGRNTPHARLPHSDVMFGQRSKSYL